MPFAEVRIPCLQSVDDLRNTCTTFGLNLNCPPLAKREPDLSNADEVYEVERIVDYAKDPFGNEWYYVKWKNWPPETNSWEPKGNLKSCHRALEVFHKKSCSTNQWSKKLKQLSSTKGMTFDSYLNSITKPTASKLRALMQQAMNKKSKNSKIFPQLLKRSLKQKGLKNITSQLKCYQPSDKNMHIQKRATALKLKEWEAHLNALSTDTAPIIVENNVDFEGPPENFTYINDYKPGEGIVIPDDPLVGCECTDCFDNRKKCCASQCGALFAYTRYRRVNVLRGSPIYECNKRCKCPPECPNRVVQHGRKVKLAIFRTDNGCGWGVKTLEPIKKDMFVMEYVGEVITTEEAEKRGQIYDTQGRTYLFDLDYDGVDCPFTVDAATYGNISHFMNHSCEPNLIVYGVWINTLDPRLPRIAFFSKRDIKRGEELTFDYMMTGDSAQRRNVLEQSDDSETETGQSNSLANSSTATDNGSENSLNVVDIAETNSDSGSSNTDEETAVRENVTEENVKNRILCKCGARKCRKYLF